MVEILLDLTANLKKCKTILFMQFLLSDLIYS